MIVRSRFRSVIASLGFLAATFVPGAILGQASLRFSTPQGEVLASGFVVSSEGYIATSFHAAQNATAAKLVGERGRTFDVAGWVAADKGHDLVLLALKNPPKTIHVAALDATGPAVGGVVTVSPGPLSRPITQQWAANTPPDLLPNQAPGAAPRGGPGMLLQPPALEPPQLQLRRRISGAELFAGLPPRDADAPGQAPNTDCLVISLGLEPSYAGAPLWDSARRSICGMLSGIVDADRRLRIAISVRHIEALLPHAKGQANPLNQLKKYEDPLDPAAAPAEGETAATHYHLPLADRFDAYLTRSIEWERAAGELRKSLAAAKGKLVDQRARLDAIATTMNEMVPEEAITVMETRTITEPGRDGRLTSRTVRTPVLRRQFSARQLAQQSDLAKERVEAVGKLRDLFFAWNHDERFEGPSAELRVERSRNELFYLADPFELRSEDEHRALTGRLDEAIAEGGAPGMFFLARGLSKLRLRKFAEATADFRDAEDVDGTLQNLALAAEGRRLILEGDVSKGTATLTKSLRQAPTDAAVQFLAARAELDKKAYLQSARSLTAALERGADRAETHAALAWLYATTSAGDSTNGRLAVTHARQACFATEDNDWQTLAALAAAYARTADFDRAAAALDRAKTLAPLDAHAQCDTWRAAVEAKQAIERDWR